CCAADGTDHPVRPLLPFEVNPHVDGEGANWATVRRLFFSGSGLVDVNSSDIGQLSYCSDKVGGDFTSALTYELCREPTAFRPDGAVTWNQFLTAVDDCVEDAYVTKEVQLSKAWFINESPEQRWEKILVVKNDSEYDIDVHVEFQTYTT